MKTWIASRLGLAIAFSAMGEEYPSRALRVIVPTPPGGTVDFVARAVTGVAGPRLGQPIVVEPKPGGNSVIGMELASRAAPDGYTIMVAAATSFTLNTLVSKMPFDAVKAFTPVALLAST